MTRATVIRAVDIGPTPGVTAMRDEVLAVAGRIDEVALRSRRRSERAASILAVVTLTAPLAPVTAAAAQATLGAVLVGPGGLLSTSRSLELTADAARSAIGLLSATDEAMAFSGPVETVLGLAARAVLAGTSIGVGARGLVDAYAGEEGAARIAAGAALGEAPPLSLPGLLDRLSRVNQLPAGSIEVLTLTSPTGGRRHVVTLPGTDGFDRDLARSFAGDAAIRTGQVTTYERGIVAAMRASGVRPGEPVLLVGHSMGGMVAAEIARRPAGFRITQVVTAGSPIGDRPLPSGVRLLAMEHATDPVPRLDAARLPDVAGHRVTVTFSDLGAGPRNPHDLTHYRHGATLAAGSSDPLVRDAVSEVEKFLDEPPGTQASSRVWQISRAGG